MPPRGGEVRAEQLGTLGRLAHDALVSDDVGRWLEELAPYEESQPYDSDEASLIRTVAANGRRSAAFPGELAAEILRSNSLALPLWAEARQRSDFSLFLPALRRNLDLRRRYIECFDGLRRAVRRPARRFRAGHEDGGGARGVHAAEGGAGAARRGGSP